MNISSVVSLTLSLEQVGNNATNGKENSDTKQSDLQSLDLFYQPNRHGWLMIWQKSDKKQPGQPGHLYINDFSVHIIIPKAMWS